MAELKNIRGNYLAQKLGNFPLDCECLNYAQKRDDISQALGCIGGDRVLLSGFNADGSGLVFVKTNECPWGEVMPVKAGSGSTLHLVSEPVRVDFSAEDVFPQAYFDRYLEYGTVYGAGAENFPVASFWKLRNNKVIYEALQAEIQAREAADMAADKNLSTEITTIDGKIAETEAALTTLIEKAQATADAAATPQYVNNQVNKLSTTVSNNYDALITAISKLKAQLLPRGVIVAWSGSPATIPSGWALCDGTNGTPPLSGKFIRAWGNGIAPTGGRKEAAADIYLTAENIPYHRHKFIGDSNIKNHQGGDADIKFLQIKSDASASGQGVGALYLTGSEVYTREGNLTGNSINNDKRYISTEKFEIIPPYYALCYIMKL